MKTYLKLAWRNIWRNKRRTLLTTASISLAIFLAILMRSLQIGTYQSMVDNIVQSYTGYIQIHKKGYWAQREDINNTFELNQSLVNKLDSIKNISVFAPRLESFALASKEEQTKGIALVGINPEKEERFTKISKKIVEGKYLKDNDNGVLISQKLAKFLKVNVNDTVVLIGQGLRGSSAAGKYPVRGIIHFPSPDLDNRMIFMSLSTCQEFFSSDNRLTSISLNLKDPDLTNETLKEIKKAAPADQYEVMTWNEMLIELVQFIKSKDAGSYFLIGILYMIVSFGIFGTVLMMTSERIKEFGVVVSIGMQKTKLAVIVAIEMIYVGIIGILAGVVAAFPIVYYYFIHPIRLTGNMAKTFETYGIEPVVRIAFQSNIFVAHSITVLLIVFFAIIYPMRKIIKLNIVNALRSK